MAGELHNTRSNTNIEVQTLNMDNESSFPHVFARFKTRIHEKISTEIKLNPILLDFGSQVNLLFIKIL